MALVVPFEVIPEEGLPAEFVDHVLVVSEEEGRPEGGACPVSWVPIFDPHTYPAGSSWRLFADGPTGGFAFKDGSTMVFQHDSMVPGGGSPYYLHVRRLDLPPQASSDLYLFRDCWYVTGSEHTPILCDGDVLSLTSGGAEKSNADTSAGATLRCVRIVRHHDTAPFTTHPRASAAARIDPVEDASAHAHLYRRRLQGGDTEHPDPEGREQFWKRVQRESVDELHQKERGRRWRADGVLVVGTADVASPLVQHIQGLGVRVQYIPFPGNEHLASKDATLLKAAADAPCIQCVIAACANGVIAPAVTAMAETVRDGACEQLAGTRHVPIVSAKVANDAMEVVRRCGVLDDESKSSTPNLSFVESLEHRAVLSSRRTHSANRGANREKVKVRMSRKEMDNIAHEIADSIKQEFPTRQDATPTFERLVRGLSGLEGR